MNTFYENLEKNNIVFENNNINVIIDDDDVIWFNANDIAISLGYKYPKDAIINNVAKEDKTQLSIMNINYKIKKHPHSVYINESGLYSLMINSRLEKSKKFKLWITQIVLPSIRKFGYYKLKKEHESNINEIMKKINILEKQNEKLKNELKPEKYPDGLFVYIVDYTDEQENMYKLGKTDDMDKRKKIYNTHTIYKKNVILMKDVECPLQYETCIRAMLYNYRIKNRKDFYECNIKKIEKAFEKCDESIKCINQAGGNRTILDLEIDKLKKRINKIQLKINKYNEILSIDL
jgi:prophage antirepressor-like protein